MSSPIYNENSLFPNMKQLTNRKNKFTIKYNSTDEIEEAIYLKKQRRYLKNRSEFFSNQNTSEPKIGEIVKIYNIEYYVEAFNQLNGKHTLVNTRNFQRRYFDLQLYTWNYIKPLFTNKFKIPEPIKPTIRSNLLLKQPLPAIPRFDKVKPIFDIQKSPLVSNFKENYVPNPLSNLTINLPVSPVKSPLKMNKHSSSFTFDIEAQQFLPEPFKLLDLSPPQMLSLENGSPIVESDLKIEDLDIIEDAKESNDSDNSIKEEDDDITIGSCVNYDYFTGENIKNWDLPKKSSPLIIVHDNSKKLEVIQEDDCEDTEVENEENAGYCTIM